MYHVIQAFPFDKRGQNHLKKFVPRKSEPCVLNHAPKKDILTLDVQEALMTDRQNRNSQSFLDALAYRYLFPRKHYK